MGLRLMRRPDAYDIDTDEPATTAEHRVRLATIRGFEGIITQDVSPDEGRALVASAQLLAGGKGTVQKRLRLPSQSWQREVWELRRETGEIRFSGDRVARGLSRVRLFVAERAEPGAEPTPVTDGPLAEMSGQMFDDGAPSLHRAGQQLVYTGETLLVVSQDEETGAMRWEAFSTTEVTQAGKAWKIADGSGVDRKLGDNDILSRCWTPDPERGFFAESPVQAILPVARELRGLTQRVAAEIDSRLAGNGLLLVPDSIEALAGQAGPKKGMSDFLAALLETMTKPIGDRNSAAAVVPLVAKVPAAVVDKIKHISFSTPFDKETKSMRDEAIRRIALGMDSSPEVLLGLGSGANHWSAWQIAEDEVKLVIAPLAQTVCHPLTVNWLRPVCQVLGLDPAKYLVWYDPSALELRPDRSKDAQLLHEKGLVSDAVTRRESGFSDEDKPNPEEYTRWLLMKLALQDPRAADALFESLGIKLKNPMPGAEKTTPAGGGEPATEDEPSSASNPLPEQPDPNDQPGQDAP